MEGHKAGTGWGRRVEMTRGRRCCLVDGPLLALSVSAAARTRLLGLRPQVVREGGDQGLGPNSLEKGACPAPASGPEGGARTLPVVKGRSLRGKCQVQAPSPQLPAWASYRDLGYLVCNGVPNADLSGVQRVMRGSAVSWPAGPSRSTSTH